MKRKGELVAQDLVLALRDGRAIIRANAALGLAALGYTGRDLLPFLRDSEALVAQSAAEALLHLMRAQREHLVPIAAALDGARPEVVDTVTRMFAELVGQADAELVGVLDTADRGAANAVVEGCARVGVRGLHLLQAAARDDRALVRLNAIRGVGRLAYLEPVSSIEIMQRVASEDSVSDVRAGALAALAAYQARSRAAAATKAGQPMASRVPALMLRALTPDELSAAVTGARLDELLAALDDPRVEIRLNAARVLALQGAADGAPALAVATRDPDPTIRVESVSALAALARIGVVVAPALARALGDADPAVVAAAEAALAEQGTAAAQALVDSLEVASEPHGARVAGLIGRLPDGPSRLREALASTSVDVRVNAALGLAALGKARAGAVLAALSAATSGGNARVRAAVAKAVAAIAPRPERALPPLAIDGFEQRALAEADLAKHKDALAAAGVAGLAPRLADARPAVRANTALGLGILGGDPASPADALAACLRDDAAEVRTSAARALARLGEPAIAACAHDLVRALRGADAALTAQLVAMIRAHGHPAIGAALVRALDTTDDHHARQICELVCARPAAVDLLCDAFGRPGAQANAARGFAILGKDKLGTGRALLERARTASEARVRELARATLLAIDGPPIAPAAPAIAGFETALLDKAAFAAAGALDLGALLGFLHDGRAVVRANAATAVGTLGPAAAGHAITIAALLRDDDDRVRIAAAQALDQLGDDAVVAAAPYVVGALRGDPRLAEVCRAVLAARKSRVEAALLAGLETPDQVHGMRIADLLCALPNARELLFAAFDGEAQNVRINAAFGIAKLGTKRAGPDGRQRLLNGLPGPPTRRRDAMVKALAMLDESPAR
ncbi:MAG TPA: HEAT repeat domain-containing protein [Kofleriaceae bacterium]|nr:HEAT repeat domain-containing protein [Kofleriaceae bacterium]